MILAHSLQFVMCIVRLSRVDWDHAAKLVRTWNNLSAKRTNNKGTNTLHTPKTAQPGSSICTTFVVHLKKNYSILEPGIVSKKNV